MLTQGDILKMKQVFATKQDLKDLQDDLAEKFVTNERFDQALGKLDFIIGEVQKVREEQTIHYLKHEEIDQDLAAIKAVPAVAHDLKR